MQSKFGRDLPKTTKDLNCQSQTNLYRVFLILNFSTTTSHFLGYEVRFRDVYEHIIYNHSFLEFHCSLIRSVTYRTKC